MTMGNKLKEEGRKCPTRGSRNVPPHSHINGAIKQPPRVACAAKRKPPFHPLTWLFIINILTSIFTPNQSIREFCSPDMPIFMYDKNGDYITKTLDDVSDPCRHPTSWTDIDT